MKIINRLFFMVALLVGCAAAGMERPENGTWVYLYSDERKQSFVSNYDSANPDPFIEGWVDTIHERRRDLSWTDIRLELLGNTGHFMTRIRAYRHLSNHIPTEKINSLSNEARSAILYLKNTMHNQILLGDFIILPLGYLDRGELGSLTSTQDLVGMAYKNSNVNGDPTQTTLRHLAAIDAEIGDKDPATWWKQLYKGTLPDKRVSNPTSNPHNPDSSPNPKEESATTSQPAPPNTNPEPISSNVAVTSSLPNGTTQPIRSDDLKHENFTNDGALDVQEFVSACYSSITPLDRSVSSSYELNDWDNLDKNIHHKLTTIRAYAHLASALNEEQIEAFNEINKPLRNAFASLKIVYAQQMRELDTLLLQENISFQDMSSIIDQYIFTCCKEILAWTIAYNTPRPQQAWINLLNTKPKKQPTPAPKTETPKKEEEKKPAAKKWEFKHKLLIAGAFTAAAIVAGALYCTLTKTEQQTDEKEEVV